MSFRGMFLVAVTHACGDVNNPITWEKGWEFLRETEPYCMEHPRSGGHILLRKSFRGKTLVQGLLMFPIVVPELIAEYALWLTLLPNEPLSNTLELALKTNEFRGKVVNVAYLVALLTIRLG